MSGLSHNFVVTPNKLFQSYSVFLFVNLLTIVIMNATDYDYTQSKCRIAMPVNYRTL